MPGIMLFYSCISLTWFSRRDICQPTASIRFDESDREAAAIMMVWNIVIAFPCNLIWAIIQYFAVALGHYCVFIDIDVGVSSAHFSENRSRWGRMQMRRAFERVRWNIMHAAFIIWKYNWWNIIWKYRILEISKMARNNEASAYYGSMRYVMSLKWWNGDQTSHNAFPESMMMASQYYQHSLFDMIIVSRAAFGKINIKLVALYSMPKAFIM